MVRWSGRREPRLDMGMEEEMEMDSNLVLESDDSDEEETKGSQSPRHKDRNYYGSLELNIRPAPPGKDLPELSCENSRHLKIQNTQEC